MALCTNPAWACATGKLGGLFAYFVGGLILALVLFFILAAVCPWAALLVFLAFMAHVCF